jgi:ornithine carbamoyltransferase
MSGEFGLSGWKGTAEDLARALGRLYSGIVYQGTAHATAETLAKYSGVPVFNANTERFHPAQALADLFTIEESLGALKGKRLVYFGDGRSGLASSLVVIASKLGLDLSLATPSALWPSRELWDICQGFAAASGSSLSVSSDPVEAVRAADAIYVDPRGMPEDFRIDEALMEKTGNPATIFLQSLGGPKGKFVAPELFEGPASKVFDQVENGKHALKAILLAAL